MWAWLVSKAETAEDAPAADSVVEEAQPAEPAEPEPASAGEAPAEEEAPAPVAEEKEPEPEPGAMKEPTPKEVEVAKAELINEAVKKVLSASDDLLANEVVTAPYDPRFPATNQARHCFVRYNEYYKCVFERGAESSRCAFYKRAYESLCPDEWVEEWEELREKGLWMGKY